MKTLKLSICCLTSWLLGHSVLLAETQWTRFRGPQANGIAADDPRLPMRWSKTENILWKSSIPGLGWSSPVIWGDRVFVTTVQGDGAFEKPKAGLYNGEGRKEIPEGLHRWLVYCLDIHSGDLLWTREVHRGSPPVGRHPKNTYASETPCLDSERLYALFGDLGLFCLSHQGDLLWEKRFKPSMTMRDYGAAASPVVHGDQVFVQYDNSESSFIASYDTQTGKQRWQSSRNEKTTWATPFIWQNDIRTELVTAGRNRIRSYDLDGKLIWELDGKMSVLTIPSPFAAHGALYVTSGYFQDRRRPVWVIKSGAKGDISLADGQSNSAFVLWHHPKLGPYNTSPIVHGDYYYTLLDQGMMTCHHAQTGEEVYDRTRFPLYTSFTASPWAYNGNLFCLAESGMTYVLKSGPEFEIIQENNLDELCIATPSIAQGKLFIRTESSIYCISKKTVP
ncbi:MAG: PQQ-binding-like beta-propeller repeat protein [Verrucomicrobiota bacterium]|nr:PQQ-binding-like beta-propeller repeat protein [Verrucomicrobiota bacterium]